MTMSDATAVSQLRAIQQRDTILLRLIDSTEGLQQTIEQRDLTIVGLNARIADDQTAIDGLNAQHAADLETIAELQERIKQLEGDGGEEDPPPETLTQFGALCGVMKDSGETKAQARARVTALYGGMAVERIYLGSSFAPVNVGHSVIGTWAFPDMAAVAAGQYDAQITAFCKAWTGPGTLYAGPNHEPDQDGRSYTAAQFSAAAARVCQVIKAAGNPLVKSTVILMSYTLTKGPDAWKAWYAGYEPDVIGWDGYWRPTTQRTAEAVLGPCRDAAAGKPWLIGEISMGALHNLGSMERDSWVPIPEAEWTKFVAESIPLLQTSGCVAATWFETNLVDGDGRIAPHPEALGLWSAAVQASA